MTKKAMPWGVHAWLSSPFSVFFFLSPLWLFLKMLVSVGSDGNILQHKVVYDIQL
jgi:hypothetical protein